MTLQAIAEKIQVCKECPLHKDAKQGVPGEGPANASIVFIGEAPGRSEDEQGRPFVGRAGILLEELLHRAGLHREQVYITNVVKHRPPDNRPPKTPEIKACKHYLEDELMLLKPKLVVLLGGTAKKIRDHPLLKQTTVFETIHPAAAIRFPGIWKKRLEDDFDRLGQLVKQMGLV